MQRLHGLLGAKAGLIRKALAPPIFIVMCWR
jgi:hypothetical protein